MKTRRHGAAGLFGMLLCLCGAGVTRAQEALPTITLYYNDRPPYLVPAADGSASGLTGSPAAAAFKAASIAVQWAKVPTNRQLMSIRRDAGPECAIGWFRNAEREQFAKFTKAIYRDLPTVALASRDFKAVREGSRLEDVLAMKGLRVLAKDNYSYGPTIDALLARLKPTIIYTTSENSAMVEMVRFNRADFMFVAEEEAAYLVEEAGLSAREFHLIRFADVPRGERRHIMCSKQVPDEVIARLNRAITFE